MAAISVREQRLIIITLLVILYAVLGFTLRGRLDNWRAARKQAGELRTQITDRRMLIGSWQTWDNLYADLSSLMPLFETETKVETYFYKIMDDAAAKTDMSITRRRVRSEELKGDVHEIAIECTDWRGTIDALVKFLYELQKNGVMLDVRSLFIRPESNNPANLQGSFTLYCAFMRTAPANGNTP